MLVFDPVLTVCLLYTIIMQLASLEIIADCSNLKAWLHGVCLITELGCECKSRQLFFKSLCGYSCSECLHRVWANLRPKLISILICSVVTFSMVGRLNQYCSQITCLFSFIPLYSSVIICSVFLKYSQPGIPQLGVKCFMLCPLCPLMC